MAFFSVFRKIQTLTRLPDLCGRIPVAGLLKIGAFKTVIQRHPIMRNPKIIIPPEKIDRFKSEYVFFFTLSPAGAASTSPCWEGTSGQGVYPAPELEGPVATLFRHSGLPS